MGLPPELLQLVELRTQGQGIREGNSFLTHFDCQASDLKIYQALVKRSHGGCPFGLLKDPIRQVWSFETICPEVNCFQSGLFFNFELNLLKLIGTLLIL